MIRHLRLTATAHRMSLRVATWFVVAFVGEAGPFDPAFAAAADARSQAPRITITGRVRAQGDAVPHAVVYLREAPVSWSTADVGMRPTPTRNIAKTEADADGRFEFENVQLPEMRLGREHTFPLDVIALAPGHGVAWRHVEAPPFEPLELTLPSERKVAGRLIQPDGSPAAGVRVRVREIADLADPWRPAMHDPGYLDLEPADVPLAAIAGADGRFSVDGLPADIRATLVIDDDRYRRSETYVATTDEPQGDLIRWPARPGSVQPHAVPVQVGQVEIEVERTYRVFGKVVFADTGKPAAGAGWNTPPVISPPTDFTGADGWFALSGLARGTISLWITPPAGSGYLGISSRLELSGERYDVEHTIELPRGEVVRGRVEDASSGRGIGGAQILYVGQQVATQNPRPFSEKVVSAADGRFAITVFPGKAELVVTGSVPGYITHYRSGLVSAAPAEFHRPIDVRAGQTQPEVTFELQPNPTASLNARVIDADLQPVASVEIRYQAFGAEDGHGRISPAVETKSDSAGAFALNGFEPSLQCEVRALHRRRGLGCFVLLPRADQPRVPLTIELKPLAVATGRVVDENDRPIAGSIVQLFAAQGDRYSHVDGEPVTTDLSGRFDLPGLLPGATYYLATRADGYAAKDGARFTPVGGEDYRVGEITLPRADQEIAGVLVDSHGKPVVGAQVYALSMFPDSRVHARTQTRLTDSQGRFRLKGLPHGNAIVWQSFDQFHNRESQLGQVTAGTTNLRLIIKEPAEAAP